MSNLREEIEKILDTNHCDSCLSDNCYYEEEGGGIGVDICCFHQPEQATDQILTLLKGVIPTEQNYPLKASIDTPEEDARELRYFDGYNQAIADIKDKMK